MKALYDARIEDLGPGDFVRVECSACGHDEFCQRCRFRRGYSCRRIPASSLEQRFRCRECDAKGKAVVSVRWGNARE